MTLTIELTPEEEARLQQEAERAGTTPEEYAHLLLSEDLVGPSLPMTPAQALAYWKREGLLGSYGDPTLDAQQLARKLRREVWGGRGADADD